MARKRMLSPEFFTSQTVARLTVPARLTFAGLWTYCDDFGRGLFDPTMLKASIWPRDRAVTEKKVAAHVAEMESLYLVHRYDVAGHELLHLPSWHEHQKISHRTESKLPPCQAHEPGLFEAFANDDDVPRERFRRFSGATAERLHDKVVESKREEVSSGDTARPTPERISSILRATS